MLVHALPPRVFAVANASFRSHVSNVIAATQHVQWKRSSSNKGNAATTKYKD
jgi:hypothetical protein